MDRTPESGTRRPRRKRSSRRRRRPSGGGSNEEQSESKEQARPVRKASSRASGRGAKRSSRRRRKAAPKERSAAEVAVALAKQAAERTAKAVKSAPRRPTIEAVTDAAGEGVAEPLSIEEATGRLGFESLHEEQARVVGEVLEGNDVLMILPTGFGKSACYQVPSMVLPKPTVVISPLLALMRDQYEKLARLGVPCVRLDGGVRGGRRKAALQRIAAGGPLLVMTTPETLATDDAAKALGQSGISLAAVDEAHCISEWGYDFRPAYLQIHERLRAFGNPPILALTATATEKVRDAIQRFLGMRDPVVVATSPHRSNLAFDVVDCTAGDRHRALMRLALRVRRPGIIYCATTKAVDEVFTLLQGFRIASYRYHGKMSAAERSHQQDEFMRNGRRSIMVATNAFGLGIDKQDIRYVMHFQAPASLEQYVQEAGRAGRDGKRSNCILLYAPEDREIHEALLMRSRVRPEQLYKLGRALKAWAEEEKVPDLDALALSAELGTRTTAALLAILEEATLVRFDTSAVFVLVPPDEIEGEARKLAGQFETLRTEDSRRLDAVAEYGRSQGCRAAFLRGYFGEEEGEPCGLCDICRGSTERPESFFDPLHPPKANQRKAKGRGGRGGGRSRKPGGSSRGRDASRGNGEERPVAGEPARSEAGSGHGRRRRRGSRSRRRGRRPRSDGEEGTPPEPSPPANPG